MRLWKTISASAIVTILMATAVTAKTITVKMLNSGVSGSMVFEPDFVRAQVGDIVQFVPTALGHNAQLIDGMAPDGVQVAPGIIGKPFALPITKPGLYGIECKPHFSLGMVALIKAGNGHAPNAKQAGSIKLPPLAAKRMNLMLANAGR